MGKWACGECLRWGEPVASLWGSSQKVDEPWSSPSCWQIHRGDGLGPVSAGGWLCLGWPGQPDVPLLIITGTALWAKLHLGHLCKLGVSAPLLQDRLCNRIRNQIHNLDSTFFWTSGCSRFGPADFIGILLRKRSPVHARMENKCWKVGQTVTLELIFKFKWISLYFLHSKFQ